MIYDCFTFFNELDLLEIRLNILDEVVDRFVLVESRKTFTNRDKELVFEKHKNRFSKFAGKIIHVVVEDYPEYTSPWLYESVQRNAIAKGLVGACDDDVVLISDVDEIPDPDKVRSFANIPGVKVFDQRYYAYYLNYRNVRQVRWWGTKMLFYGDFLHAFDGVDVVYDEFLPEELNKGTTASKIRMRQIPADRMRTVRLFNAGWHFTSVGGAAAVVEKLRSYSHQEHRDDESRYDLENVERLIAAGKSPGLKMNCFAEKICETFPSYLVSNIDRYRHLIFNPTTEYWRNTLVARSCRIAQGYAIHLCECIIPAPVHRFLHRCRVRVRSILCRRRCRTVMARISGGLGNQLFTYATMMKIASETGREILIDDSEYSIVKGRAFLLDRFAAPSETRRCGVLLKVLSLTACILEHYGLGRFGMRILRLLGWRRFEFDVCREFADDEKSFAASVSCSSKCVYLTGCCQRLPLIADRESLRKSFALRQEEDDVVMGEDTVSVHVRRGDYLTMGEGWVLGVGYYRNAIAKMSAAVANPKWYVFSDDIEWCREKFSDLSGAVFVDADTEDPCADMIKMSKCRNHIIANSTFSWWSAYLSRDEGVVIYPDKWVAGIDTGRSLLMPDDWISVSTK
jgi:beta-1,4-mannosyl-glycoprotein beta-1,4-N-acetylglucosaminyltransferase